VPKGIFGILYVPSVSVVAEKVVPNTDIKTPAKGVVP
jgi:hypothetical protein